MNMKRQTEAGLNVIDLLFLMALAGITFAVAMAVGRRFGVGWGLLAAPATLAVAIGVYSAFYWAVGHLPYPLGASRGKRQPPKQDESNSDKVA
jgi:hypothetical protein